MSNLIYGTNVSVLAPQYDIRHLESCKSSEKTPTDLVPLLMTITLFPTSICNECDCVPIVKVKLNHVFKGAPNVGIATALCKKVMHQFVWIVHFMLSYPLELKVDVVHTYLHIHIGTTCPRLWVYIGCSLHKCWIPNSLIKIFGNDLRYDMCMDYFLWYYTPARVVPVLPISCRILT